MRVPAQTLNAVCSIQEDGVESVELNTPPPTIEDNRLAIYNEENTNNSAVDEDFNCTESYLSNTSLIEIIPAEILHAQEIYTTENVITDVVTEISENKQNVKEFTNVIVNEKRETQPIDQEVKNLSRSSGGIGRRHGRQKTNNRMNPLPSLTTSIGRGHIRQMVTQPGSSQFRTIASQRRIKIISASKQCPSTVTTQSQTPQQEDWRSRNAKQTTITSCLPNPSTVTSCLPNPGRCRLQEMPMVNQEHVHWDVTPGTQPQTNTTKLRFYQQQGPPVQQQSSRHVQIIHEEDSYFTAVTFCQKCGDKKNHTLYRPGYWPPIHCSNCGNKYAIIDWKVYIAEEDDDIQYAGEVVNTIKPKIKRPLPIYGRDGIKMEPQEEYTNIPSCRHCGGHHGTPNGQQQNPGICPHYNGTFNWNNTG